MVPIPFKKFFVLSILSAGSLFACSCSACGGCAFILPQIEEDFKSVLEKYIEKDKEISKLYSEIVDIEKSARLIEMRTNNNLKEITALDARISLEEAKEAYLLRKLSEMKSVKERLDLIEKSLGADIFTQRGE